MGRIQDSKLLNNWKIFTLQEMLDNGIILSHLDGNHGGLYPNKDEFVESGVPYISANCIVDGEVDFSKSKYLSEKRASAFSKGVAKHEDVLFAHNATVGPVAILRTDLDFVILSTTVTYYRCNKDYLLPNYLRLYLISDFFVNQYTEVMKQATRNQVPITKQRTFFHLIPPLAEQQCIVSILDEAFAAIASAKANAEQNLKNAKELFDVYLHRYYTSKENGWGEKKLKEIAEYFNGLTYSPDDVSEQGIIVLRSSNVQNDQLDFDDIVRVDLKVKDKIIVKEGDILMCSRNGSKRLVGKTATIKDLEEEMTFGAFMMIIRSEYNPYLSWFFKSTDFRKQISGGENTMINQITRYMLDDVVLSFPPIDIQDEIVQKLDALSTETKRLEAIYQQKIADLEELKKSILQKAFNGELKISEPLLVAD